MQNGNHIEPHAQRAFDLLTDLVERNVVLPPSQCIPRGGSIVDKPAFRRLGAWVESGITPPPGQCIPRGGAIVDNPATVGRPEHCAVLLLP